MCQLHLLPPGSSKLGSNCPSSQSYGFPVVMYGCESWTIKKAECRRTDAFELWCWGRHLRVPWTVRRSNQSILKENHSWLFTGRTDAEAPILWPLNVKSRLIGKDPDAGKDWEQEEKRVTEDKMGASLTQWTWVWANFGRSEGRGSLACCSPWGPKELDKI